MIDVTKPVQTLDGLAVELWDEEYPSEIYPLCGVIIHPGGDRTFRTWTKDGWFNQKYEGRLMSIVNAPEKHKFWLNIYGDGTLCRRHQSREAANSGASMGRVACIEIEYTEGEGL